MIAFRSALIASSIALAAVAAPAFAADKTTPDMSSATTNTTREDRMAAAMQDYQSGKAPATVADTPAKPAPSHGKKKHSAK